MLCKFKECNYFLGLCSRLEIGKTLRSLTQSLDFICGKSISNQMNSEIFSVLIVPIRVPKLTVLNVTHSMHTLILVKRSQSSSLTRMAVQCADGYDVASITSYQDINELYNKSLFPTNRTMIISNFNRPG